MAQESETGFDPYYYLIDVISEGRFLYRRNGSEVQRLLGKSLVGEYINLKDARAPVRTLAHYYLEVMEDRLCYRCCGTIDLDGDIRPFETVDCPLTDKDGQVCAIIGALSLTPEN